jgi:putative ABC transport system permease protein
VKGLLHRLRATLRRTQNDEEFAAELETHFSLMVEERVRRGLSREAAERDARLRLGGMAQLRESHAEWRGLRSLETFTGDVRYALRALHRSPRFAWSAILTAAVSIGAATAVFSVVDRTLLRPLPYKHGDRLISIGIHAPVIAAYDWLFAGHYREWKAHLQPPLEAVGAWKGVAACDRSDGSPERLGCLLADRDFLDVLGVTPALGRNFTAEEDEAGAAPVALLSYKFWRTRFGADPAVLGRTIRLDGETTRIVGVLPADFRTPTLEQADILRPLQLRREGQRQRVIHAVGRLTPGATAETAHAALQPLFAQFTGSAPADFRSAVPMQLRTPGLQRQQTAAYRTGLLVLLGAVLAFVLMACANVASLLLARSESRRHEFAVRASLGASPGRLVRQTLIESVVLGLGAGVGACGLAWALLRVFRAMSPGFTAQFGEAELDWRVLTFALLLAVVSALLFGLGPALERRRGENLAAPRIAAGRGAQRVRSLLTSAQFAVSVVLLTLTGMFTLSLWKLRSADLGFRTEHVVSASFILPEQRFGIEIPDGNRRQIAFFQDLEERLHGLPGLDAAAITDSLPPGGDPRSFPWVALIGGGNAAAKGKEGLVKWRFVTEDYLKVLGIPVIHGRAFTRKDRSAGPQAVIINEALALRRFGRTDVAGENIYCGDCVIVGVVGNMRNSGPRAPATPEMLVLRRTAPNGFWSNQRPPFGWRAATVIARSAVEPHRAMRELERVIHEIEPGMPVIADTLSSQLDTYMEQPRFQAVGLTMFAATAMLLAAFGLYGLTAYLAAARIREIGVRIALGASRRNIAAMLMRSGLAYTSVGIAAGTLLSLALMQAARSVLVELQALDNRVLPVILVPLAAAALTGAGLPGLRASRTDPSSALRHE